MRMRKKRENNLSCRCFCLLAIADYFCIVYLQLALQNFTLSNTHPRETRFMYSAGGYLIASAAVKRDEQLYVTLVTKNIYNNRENSRRNFDLALLYIGQDS